MTPKFFLLPALAVVIVFTALTVYSPKPASALPPCGSADCGPDIWIGGDERECFDSSGNKIGCGDGGKGKPKPETCPANSTSVGKIHAAAEKTAPLYPMVIGQDETKRGADITCSVTVDPSTRTTYTHDADGKCVRQTEVFPETATSDATVSLNADSRDWILNGGLQIRYPGAYLHDPDISLGACGGTLNAQIADPGRFVIKVSGTTSGTPVHGPRSFEIDAGEFLAYLRESAIVK